MKFKYPIFVFIFSLTGLSAVFSQELPSSKSAAQRKSYIETLSSPNPWVDSVFNKLNKRQKIAQLFFVRAHTDMGKVFEDSIANVVKKERIGGLVFFQGGPGRQAILTNRYQALARVPLLITSDGEWGLGMRLDSTISYPYQMALGAVQDKELIYRMGLEVAKDYKRIGMHMNLAPDVDVNNNPKNPVINYRSFGENKYNVTAKASAYMKGMQDGGLLVSLKHFPGHGDTDVDSHYDLPKLPFSKERLDSLEIYPFRELIKEGAAGVMIAHMNIPALDNTPNMPSTLSKPIVTGILKEELGFKGIIISDAMGMKGVVKYFKDGEADVMGIIAGNDILELSENSARAIKLVRKAVREGRIPMERIDESVKKILTAKYWAGLNGKDTINENNVYAEVNRPESKVLLQQLADASMTLLRGKQYLKTLTAQKRTAIISIGTPQVTTFQQDLGKFYKNSVFYTLDKTANANAIAKVLKEMGNFDQVIIGIHDTRTRPGNGIVLSADLKMFIKDMADKNAVFALFANPYNLAALPGLENSKVLVVAYQKEDFMQRAASSVIKNQLTTSGKLPVTVNTFFKYGDGE
ncbi:glycoside hydrolase family 3 N-terminal domain-containing protein [Pedobacter gandavensis]|uniref:glycoside hydrolase family 3 protein n=1 Tax=Pedobacter gandavensis TaxID=2679963 RepID=UPI002479BE58|nr:glycoside hydrolase family 3 N-terminal domain-containing protein [Pedobacter gandavensis]WGQ07704.1 glycoside hydrolase family 3 N-terminal domain-containing protein [Pedobacter gandavensis]